MVDVSKIIEKYEELRESYEGPGSELIARDKTLQRKRHLLENALRDIDLEIIRNGHEMAATLWPLLMKEEQDEHVTELESKP